MSAEMAYQDRLHQWIIQLQKNDEQYFLQALLSLRKEVRGCTLSISSGAMTVQFMRDHYETMKEIYTQIEDPKSKHLVADVISVLAVITNNHEECLNYRLLGSDCELGDWGQEYVRCLATGIVNAWATPSTDEASKKKSVGLAHKIVPYFLKYNEINTVIDFLVKIQHINLLYQHVNKYSYRGVCCTLISYGPFKPDPENSALMKIALDIYVRFNQFPEALKIAMIINSKELMEEVFTSCSDMTVKKQMAFMLGREQVFLKLNEDMVECDKLMEIMSNAHLGSHILKFALKYDVTLPMQPEAVYAFNLENLNPSCTIQPADSDYKDLATVFVNAFVNAGFGQNELLLEDRYKLMNKLTDVGMLSVIASQGFALLWSVGDDLTEIENFVHFPTEKCKGGELLAIGIANCRVRNKGDPALARLSDYVLHKSNVIRIGAILGLGLAYAGSNSEEILSLLIPVLKDIKSTMEVIGMTALACGMIAVGSRNPVVIGAIIQTIMHKTRETLRETHAKFLPLGLGLCYLRRPNTVEAVIGELDIIPEPLRSMCQTMVRACAYAGTISEQQLLHQIYNCTKCYVSTRKAEGKGKKKRREKMKEEKDFYSQQAIDLLGIAIITGSSDAGVVMLFRAFSYMNLSNLALRRTIPLALGLASVSNPKDRVLNALDELAHDSDSEVIYNAIFAMGLVGAGTQNARLAAIFQHLSQCHVLNPKIMFIIRVAQGLMYLGKGISTLSSYHCAGQMLSPVALAGLLATITGFLDVRNMMMGKSHYLLCMLAAAMRPKILVTLDEDLNPLEVPVTVQLDCRCLEDHVWELQNRTTPTLLNQGEHAFLATNEYQSLAPDLEDVVILRKNNSENV